MNNEETIYYDVNFYKFREGKRFSHFLIINDKEDVFSQITMKYSNSVKVKKRFRQEDSPFMLCFVKVRNECVKSFTDNIMVALDRIFITKYGNEYNNFIINMLTLLIKTLKGKT